MDMALLKHFDSLYPADTRYKEIQQTIPFLEKGLSSQIIGMPGVGKSNILRLLSYNREVRFKNFGDYEKHLHFVYIDCSEIKGRPLLDINKAILLSLSFSLGERQMNEETVYINRLIKEGLALQDEMVLFQTLKKALDYLSIEKRLTINLMFDKFDVLKSDIPSQFFTNLAILRNHAKYRFGSMFSLTRPLEDILDQTIYADFQDLITGNYVFVSLLDQIGIDFRLSYIEKASRVSLPQDTLEKVIALTGGHAKLSKLTYEKLTTDNAVPEQLSEFLLNQASIKGALLEIWNSLSPFEQLSLKENHLSQEENPYLYQTELVKNGEISIALLDSFIQSVQLEKTRNLVYDENKKDILLDQTPLSERLSPLEFKLLLFLINNPDKILSKDEIIQAVWTDTKTQEGVTDQALDQIFYRLRKKIEVKPQEPEFIHTIKGKGYRFTS